LQTKTFPPQFWIGLQPFSLQVIPGWAAPQSMRQPAPLVQLSSQGGPAHASVQSPPEQLALQGGTTQSSWQLLF
jgi:hypothetical protein